jgi:hypothetical protein
MNKRGVGKNKYGTNVLRMLREEECVIEEDIGVLRNGKIFRYSRMRTMVEREKHSEVEKRDTGVVLQNTAHKGKGKILSTQSNRRRSITSHSGQTLCRTHDPVCVSEN